MVQAIIKCRHSVDWVRGPVAEPVPSKHRTQHGPSCSEYLLFAMALVAGMPDDLAFCFERMRQDAASDVRSRALIMPALADVEERLEDMARTSRAYSRGADPRRLRHAGGQELRGAAYKGGNDAEEGVPPMGMAASYCSPHRMVRQSSIQRVDIEAELASAQVLCAQARLSVGGHDGRRIEANRALRGQLEEALQRCEDVGRSASEESASKTRDATALHDDLLSLNSVTVDMLEVGRRVLYREQCAGEAGAFQPTTWQVATVTSVNRVGGEPRVTVQIQGGVVRDTICERLFPIGRTCPGDHDLNAFRTLRDTFVCDLCNGHMPTGTRLFGCRDCDYDICEACSVAQPTAEEDLPEGRLDTATAAGRRSLATLHISTFASR